MREFRFRAWSIKDHQMLTWEEISTVDNPNYFGVATLFKEEYRYIPMEYVGIADKNGRDIYEKDIVAFCRGNGEIVWSEGGFWILYTPNASTTHHIRLNLLVGSTYEIIGNIYENPELLKDNQT